MAESKLSGSEASKNIQYWSRPLGESISCTLREPRLCCGEEENQREARAKRAKRTAGREACKEEGGSERGCPPRRKQLCFNWGSDLGECSSRCEARARKREQAERALRVSEIGAQPPGARNEVAKQAGGSEHRRGAHAHFSRIESCDHADAEQHEPRCERADRERCAVHRARAALPPSLRLSASLRPAAGARR
eukprot:scaffold253977_cov27-Tisochrysis_lutea.AAC.1